MSYSFKSLNSNSGVLIKVKHPKDASFFFLVQDPIQEHVCIELFCLISLLQFGTVPQSSLVSMSSVVLEDRGLPFYGMTLHFGLPHVSL